MVSIFFKWSGHDIIHQDIKPANILIKDGVFKLTKE